MDWSLNCSYCINIITYFDVEYKSIQKTQTHFQKLQNHRKMKLDISIPKELLAQIDFANTVNGGMAETKAQAWREQEGYKLVLKAPSVDIEKIQIQTANQRFMVYYMMDVLEGQEQMPYFLINLPLSPEVDVERISAKFENGHIYIRAPFNDWAKGESRHIDIDKY